MKKYYKYLPFLLFALLFLPELSFAIDSIGAQTGAVAGSQGANLGAARDPREVVMGVINIFLGITGTLMLVYIVYGGWLILFSRGNDEQIKKGKSTIRTAVIALAILLSSYSIVFTVSRLLMAGDAASTPDGIYYDRLEDNTRFERDYQYNRPDDPQFFAPPNM